MFGHFSLTRFFLYESIRLLYLSLAFGSLTLGSALPWLSDRHHSGLHVQNFWWRFRSHHLCGPYLKSVVLLWRWVQPNQQILHLIQLLNPKPPKAPHWAFSFAKFVLACPRDGWIQVSELVQVVGMLPRCTNQN